jgi:hypothetical protein
MSLLADWYLSAASRQLSGSAFVRAAEISNNVLPNMMVAKNSFHIAPPSNFGFSAPR